MFYVKDKEEAFTIVELVIALVVGSGIAITILSITLFFFADIMKSSTETQLTLEAQTINRLVVEDLRVSESILDNLSPTLTDVNEPAGGWQTSNPDHILIISRPAIDSTNNFIDDDTNGTLFKNNLIYFVDDGTLFKRIVTDPLATDNVSQTTCPESLSTPTCPADKVLSTNFQNLSFELYDLNGDITTVVPDARSINITIDMQKQIYGRAAQAQNDIRITLRNPT